MRPAWPAGHLIFDFIERLLELEEIEQLPCLRLVGRPEIGFGQGFPVRLPEGLTESRAPEPHPLRQHGPCFGGEIRRAIKRRTDRVIDRPQESRDVARRRRLVPALLEALPRLSFEIENVGIILGDQHLAEMKIPVMPDLAAFEA